MPERVLGWSGGVVSPGRAKSQIALPRIKRGSDGEGGPVQSSAERVRCPGTVLVLVRYVLVAWRSNRGGPRPAGGKKCQAEHGARG